MVPVGYWAGAGAGAGALTSILITGIWIRSRFNNKYAPQYRLKLQFFTQFTILHKYQVPMKRDLGCTGTVVCIIWNRDQPFLCRGFEPNPLCKRFWAVFAKINLKGSSVAELVTNTDKVSFCSDAI